jgi:hypothetical protein
VKTGASQKNEWRQEIRNRFTTLGAGLQPADPCCGGRTASGPRRAGLFLVDGTDKMRGEDTQQFFVLDAEQLLAIQTLAIYTAPCISSTTVAGGQARRRHGAADDQAARARRQPLRSRLDGAEEMLLLLRADRAMFATDADIEQLVEHSGGHPRELLRLLRLCCEVAGWPDRRRRRAAGDRHQLAADYRYFLKPADYALLAAVDADPAQGGNDEAAQELLHRLALMQYNDGRWRRSHPVVRTLEGYQLAKAALAAYCR